MFSERASKTIWCGTAHYHATRRAPNTWRYLDTRPQQTRGDLWHQHVEAGNSRAPGTYNPDHYQDGQPHQLAITNNHIDNIDQHARSLPGHSLNAIFKYHHDQHDTRAAIRKVLPSGPPPFRPSTIVLGLNSMGALEKLKGTRIFKRMYKSKAYYLFLDVLEQLANIVDRIAKKKIELAETQVATVQAVGHKFLVKGSQLLKLKWPLVMLNPHFIKEILSNPTLLVMLFHAIEVAYLSMPATFWLKPLVKLVKQPTPEKEEETWWRRKRIYEVLNGPGSSELQPNLKTMHFRQPGNSGAPTISLAGLTQAIRQYTGKPEPDPTYYSYPPGYTRTPAVGYNQNVTPLESSQRPGPLYQDANILDSSTYLANDLTGEAYQALNSYYQKHHNGYMTSQQAKLFLANQRPPDGRPYVHGEESNVQYASDQVKVPSSGQQVEISGGVQGIEIVPTVLDSDQLSIIGAAKHQSVVDNMDQAKHLEALRHTAPSQSAELMSPSDFQMLEPRERQLILEETRKSHLEARLADELIKQQSEFVDSIVHRHDALERRQHVTSNQMPMSRTHIHGHKRGRAT